MARRPTPADVRRPHPDPVRRRAAAPVGRRGLGFVSDVVYVSSDALHVLEFTLRPGAVRLDDRRRTRCAATRTGRLARAQAELVRRAASCAADGTPRTAVEPLRAAYAERWTLARARDAERPAPSPALRSPPPTGLLARPIRALRGRPIAGGHLEPRGRRRPVRAAAVARPAADGRPAGPTGDRPPAGPTAVEQRRHVAAGRRATGGRCSVASASRRPVPVRLVTPAPAGCHPASGLPACWHRR